MGCGCGCGGGGGSGGGGDCFVVVVTGEVGCVWVTGG